MSIIYLINQQPQYVWFSHIKTILGRKIREVQEAIRKAAKEWVEEANKNNVSRMLQEMEEQHVQKSVTQINPVT